MDSPIYTCKVDRGTLTALLLYSDSGTLPVSEYSEQLADRQMFVRRFIDMNSDQGTGKPGTVIWR